MLSIVVPLYKSEANLPLLFQELERISKLCPTEMEVVFVNDGSPDACARIVTERLPSFPVRSQLILLSRNFGSFSAISAGLQHAQGDYFAVLAADLQEPPELTIQFYETMRDQMADVVFGVRETRSDPGLSMMASNLFWFFYRWMVNPEIPRGGVDIFGCNRKVRDQICAMKEVETSLVGLLFWIGFRRGFVTYDRRERQVGKSAWTFSKKMNYLVNSVFNFTDLPIRLLLTTGMIGMGLSIAAGITVLGAKLAGKIEVPGYAATMLAVSFFGGLTTVGLGIVGQYLWLTLQNARRRPAFIISEKMDNGR
jgi:polyisoprenyl-phosphate glycosyltransferase